MERVILASNNPGKIKIFQEICQNIEILLLSDIGFLEEIEETGDTFLENALLKARAVSLFARKKGNEVKTSSLNIEQRKIEKYQYKSKESVFGKKMLLLDDILTTGATIEECAKILKMHGAAKVIGAVLASGRRDF